MARAGSFEGSGPILLWATEEDGSGLTIPLEVYPPGFDTNGFDIFEAPANWNRMASAYRSGPSSVTVMDASSGSFEPDAGEGSQSSRAPSRPPTAPTRGTVGSFGVAYQTYSKNGSGGYNVSSVPNGIPGGLIQMEGYPASKALNFGSLAGYKQEANNFVTAMRRGAWTSSFVNVDDQISTASLSGTGTPFNSVSLGVLMLHGTYGTSQDFTASGCKQMYFPITSGASAQYIRMSQMNFGGPGANGLKWMLIAACFSLYHTDWSSMQSQHVKPYNGNLHLILGADTLIYTDNNILADWATDMLGDPTSFPPQAPETIQNAWYDAGIKDYGGQNFPGSIYLAAAGDVACQNDTLQASSTPTGSAFYQRNQVYP